MPDWPDPMTLGVVCYPKCGLLDVCGPLAAFGAVSNVFQAVLVGEAAGPVETAQGVRLEADAGYEDAPALDLVLVPGGPGARRRAEDEPFLRWLAERGRAARHVLSVGSGSALLARAGLLDGRRATAPARGMAWAREQGPRTRWVERARWVEDGPAVTAAGPAAGLDMALAVITRLTAPDVGENVARSLEHVWRRDPADDPFETRGDPAA
jgi:transcriptional regulator GlxA family with amidase domain